jgi:hypothetical protein
MKARFAIALTTVLVTSFSCGRPPAAKGTSEVAVIPEHATTCVTSLGPTDHPDQTSTDKAISAQLCKKLGSEGVWYLTVKADALTIMLDRSTFRAFEGKAKNGSPLQKLELREWAERAGRAFQLESQHEDVGVLLLGDEPLRRLYSGQFISGKFYDNDPPKDAK